MCSCSPIFPLLLVFTLVATSIFFIFSLPRSNFHDFPSTKLVSFVFYLSLQVFFCQPHDINVDVVVQFNPWSKFIFFCFKLITIHYHAHKQKKIKFKPRIKLNHIIDIKIQVKERLGCFILSKGQGGHVIYRQNARVLEMQNSPPPGLHEGVDVYLDDFLRTQISWMHR